MTEEAIRKNARRADTNWSDIEPAECREVAGHIKESEEALRDDIWASFRYAVIADAQGAEACARLTWLLGIRVPQPA